MRVLRKTPDQLILDVSPVPLIAQIRDGISMIAIAILLPLVVFGIQTSSGQKFDPPFLLWGAAGVLIFIGVASMLAHESFTICLYKERDEMLVKKRNLISVSVRTYQLSSIEMRIVEKSLAGIRGTIPGYDIHIRSPLSNSPLTNIYTAYMAKKEILDEIRKFLTGNWYEKKQRPDSISGPRFY
jgi:hypothetical protein